jgi:hypothetical protein
MAHGSAMEERRGRVTMKAMLSRTCFFVISWRSASVKP